jgi:hypothetical protein
VADVPRNTRGGNSSRAAQPRHARPRTKRGEYVGRTEWGKGLANVSDATVEGETPRGRGGPGRAHHSWGVRFGGRDPDGNRRKHIHAVADELGLADSLADAVADRAADSIPDRVSHRVARRVSDEEADGGAFAAHDHRP